MNPLPVRNALWLVALFAAFCLGVVADRWVRVVEPVTPQPAAVPASVSTVLPPTPALAAAPLAVDRLTTAVGQPEMSRMPAASIGTTPAPRLRLPIDGVSVESLKGSFSQKRGSRPHDAADIVVPQGTPIHAVQDGTIAKLFFSQYGGNTIYHFDPDQRLCFYYAHLDRYADGLHDGQHILQGEVIGYVGTSGNAAGTPHLHFAVHELTAARTWWQGRPLDPYLVFKGQI